MAIRICHSWTFDAVPRPVEIEHYRPRASAGLIVTETLPTGISYLFTSGLHKNGQAAGLRNVTKAVRCWWTNFRAVYAHQPTVRSAQLGSKQPTPPSLETQDLTARHYPVNCPCLKRPYIQSWAMNHSEILQSSTRSRPAARATAPDWTGSNSMLIIWR
jgi:hypothetical protein